MNKNFKYNVFCNVEGFNVARFRNVTILNEDGDLVVFQVDNKNYIVNKIKYLFKIIKPEPKFAQGDYVTIYLNKDDWSYSTELFRIVSAKWENDNYQYSICNVVNNHTIFVPKYISEDKYTITKVSDKLVDTCLNN